MMSVVTIFTAFGIVLFGMGSFFFLTSTNKSKIKICPACKNQIQPDTKSCPFCGYILH